MKTHPAGSSLETCRTAGQGEKSCPVCQACGGVSGLGSASGSGSGLGPGPGSVLGSGQGPGAISVTGLVPGFSSGPTATLGSALGTGSGAGSGLRPGAGSVHGPVPQPGAGSVHGLVPQPGAGSVHGLVPQPGAGSVHGLVTQPGAGSVHGLVPQPGAGPVPQPEPGPLPQPGAESVHGLVTQPGSGPVHGLVTQPGAGPVDGLVTQPGGAGPVHGLVTQPGAGPVHGPVPQPGAGSVHGPLPQPGAGPVPQPGAGPVPQPGAGPVPQPGAGSLPQPGAGSLPQPGAGSLPQPGAGSLPQPGAGSLPQPGTESLPQSGAGPVPQLVSESVPKPGPAPLPGLGLGPGTRRGSGTGSNPSESVTTPEQVLQQKTQARPTQTPRQKVLVTGGGGYLGFSLGSSLAKRGISVTLLDLRRPLWPLPSGTEFIQADVRDEEALYQAFQGVDCVFHVASYGMSGAEKLQKQQIESINVGGTKVVINVCVRRRVPRLVYTSTVNVTFGGKPIELGDEDSVPYFPLDKHMDHYSRTKAIADQLTLMANGTPLLGGGTLRTCVLRPPGIYGPEEQRHLPRVASHIKKRLFMFRFGDRRTRMNWVHVQNLVQAHILAAEALTMAKGYVASGQAYYINDGESVNLFEWMAPLFEKLGYSQPWIWVPTSCVYLTAALMEYLHLALRPICAIPPLLTRSEVLSVAVTHTFQIAKARAQLGYAPDKFSFADAVERYVQATTPQPHGFTTLSLLRLLLLLLLLLGLLGLVLHFPGLQPLQAATQRL